VADARVGTTPYWFHFIDWPPEQGGTPKPAAIDTWLYIFQAHDKAARLYEEVLLQPANQDQPEMYFRVDLNRHKGKSPRPIIEPGQDSLWLDDDSHHVLDDLRYYILCSPFQLHWSRIENLASTKDPKKFHKLATDERGLRMIHLDTQNTKPGPGSKLRIKAIWSPWGQALALSRVYQLHLHEWNLRATTMERQQWRALFAAIDMMNRGRELKGLLDENERKRIYALLLEDDSLFAKVEQAAQKVVTSLESPAMKAMELDAAATTNPDDREAFAAIRVVVEKRLGQTRVGRKYRQEWFEEHHNLVLFDVGAAQKVTRKVSKAVFTWAKTWADAAAGSPSFSKGGSLLHRFLLDYAKKQAYMFTGIQLVEVENFKWFEAAAEKRAKKVLAPSEFAEWERLRGVVELHGGPPPAWASKLEGMDRVPAMFTKESLGELKKAVNENPRLNCLFALADAVNVAFAMRTLFEGDGKDGGDKAKRIAGAVSGLCSFLSSSLGVVKSTSIAVSGKDLRELRTSRSLSLEAHDLLTSYEEQGVIRRGLAQASATRALTSGLGAVGAAADAISYGIETGHGLHEAKTGDSPDRIWIWPGLGVLGSTAALIGYCVLLANPAGAVLIGLGSLTAALATAGSVFWPGLVSSDTDKWLMHSFVGKHRLSYIEETESFTHNKKLTEYHGRLDLQLAALDYVLFDFQPTCEIYEEHGRPRLKIDVSFRQLKCHSKVKLKVFGKLNGRWGPVLHRDDWRPPVGRTLEDDNTHLRDERAARYIEGVSAEGFDEMKISVQIDVLGDGTFLYPKDAKEAFAKA
jgi:hypothetical protein